MDGAFTQGKCDSPVGCGDATLGGFAFAEAQGITGEEALRLAAACGTANCVATRPTQISLKTVQSLVSDIEVCRLAR
jgi:fructose-1-phosphate kinase PfkB-like protein